MELPNITVLESNYLKGFDVHLQEFYKEVIGKEIGFKIEKYSEHIRGALKELVLHYKKDYTKKAAIDLRFSTKKRRCAYVLKNSPMITNAVADHFSKLLLQNRNLLEKPHKKRCLNLCCLGGGPAPEVVAITKILGTLYLSTVNPEPFALKVTIVDVEEQWKTTCGYVLECLREDRNFEGIEKIAIDFNFIQADLIKPFDDDLKGVIKMADIVTMVYFLSTINGGEDTDEGFQMVKNIMETINKDCILFFLNNATDVHYQQMDRAAKQMGDMEIIYEPCVEELRFLTVKSVEKFLEIYPGYFDYHNCMTHSFLSYCAWRKADGKLVVNKVKEEKREKRLKLQKNDGNLTQEMKEYKRILRNLFGNRELLEESEKPKASGQSKTKNSSELPPKSIENHQKIVLDSGNNVIEKEFERENCSNEHGKNFKHFEKERLGVKELHNEEELRILKEGFESHGVHRRGQKAYDTININNPNKYSKINIEKERHEKSRMTFETKIQNTNNQKGIKNACNKEKQLTENPESEKKINYNLNGDEGRQIDIYETKEALDIKLKENTSNINANKQHENHKNSTQTEEESGNTNEKREVKEDAYSEKGNKHAKKEDNSSEESGKGEPGTNNERKSVCVNKPKVHDEPLPKPRKLKSKDAVLPSQKELNDRDSQHDTTVIDKENTKQEKGNEEGESGKNKITIEATQDKNEVTLKSSDAQPTLSPNQVNVTTSVNNSMKKPSVPTTLMIKPRKRKG